MLRIIQEKIRVVSAGEAQNVEENIVVEERMTKKEEKKGETRKKGWSRRKRGWIEKIF